MNSEKPEEIKEEIEINLLEVIKILWNSKAQIIISVFFFSTFSIKSSTFPNIPSTIS